MLETRLSLLFRNELSKARTGHTTIIKNIKINGLTAEHANILFISSTPYVTALLTSLETSLGTSLAKFGARRNTHVQMSTFFKFRA